MTARWAAFISYSHKDRAVAEWLQRAVETFRVPDILVGTPGTYGLVPPRIAPVFRDRADFAASGDLSASVAAALAASDAMVVIASPDAARSRWVAEEVRRFKARGGTSRLFVLVAAGVPGAADAPGLDPALECLPLSLRREVGADGVVGSGVVEPMCADLAADGRHGALLKLVCGLLGVPLDALVHRDHARRQRRLAVVAGALLAAAAGTGALAWTAIDARDAARAERAEAERLVEFMLGDLRGRLEKVGRLDLLDAVGSQALGYYARRKPSTLDADSLARQAKALHLIGELRMLRGDYAPAEAAFARAAATTLELMERAPDDGARVFDHAQSVFWVGNVAFERGRLDAAARAFGEYARLADRLVTLDPENAAWRGEVGFSQMNLGTIRYRQHQGKAAARAFTTASATFEEIAQRDPRNDAAKMNLGLAKAWLADTHFLLGDLTAAETARREEIALYRLQLKLDPDDRPTQVVLAVAIHALGQLALTRGDLPAARGFSSEAERLDHRLQNSEPGDRQWLASSIDIHLTLSETLAAIGDLGGAAEALGHARRATEALVARDPSEWEWRRRAGRVAVLAAEQAGRRGDLETARTMRALAARDLPAPIAAPPDELVWSVRMAVAPGVPIDVATWREVATAIARVPGDRSLLLRCLEIRAQQASGMAVGSGLARQSLKLAGFRHPACADRQVAQ